MQPRLSLLTLGVRDIARARLFYERLGFEASELSNAHVAFFNAGGVVLALFGREALATDANVADDAAQSGFSGITLAHNVRSEAEVEAVLNDAERAGARIVKKAEKTFWGGYAGYFADPDGHLWEIAHNPFWPLTDEGRVILPGKTP